MLHVHNLWRQAPGRSCLENRNKEKTILKWLCKICLLLIRIELKRLYWRSFLVKSMSKFPGYFKDLHIINPQNLNLI
jgi:hypothetical protein